jgi:hypothetical protein
MGLACHPPAEAHGSRCAKAFLDLSKNCRTLILDLPEAARLAVWLRRRSMSLLRVREERQGKCSASLAYTRKGRRETLGPMNRLGSPTSPYLLQHADNPVDWWEWGDDAFAEARRREVPILISIGYAACHWCHVMR